jgi:hypothetical protein
MPTGETLKREGMARALTAAEQWRARAWLAMDELAQDGEPFTSEDLVDLVGLPSRVEGANTNNAVGAIFAAAARRRLIERVGIRNAQRPALHAAALTVWKGTQ